MKDRVLIIAVIAVLFASSVAGWGAAYLYKKGLSEKTEQCISLEEKTERLENQIGDLAEQIDDLQKQVDEANASGKVFNITPMTDEEIAERAQAQKGD